MSRHSQGILTSSHMVVMPSNNSGIRIGRLCGMFPNRLGWLIGPGGWRKPPPWMPIALDNGAFGAWKNNKPWDEHAWWSLLETAYRHSRPLWAVVPDVVTDKDATIAAWHRWSPIMRREFPDLPQAFAVQDGMTPLDVPGGVSVVFVGGSTEWKWESLEMWTKHFPKVHVGKVNTERLLWKADQAGAISCDGTGWFRGGDERLDELERYLQHSHRLDRKAAAVLSDPAEYYEVVRRDRHPIWKLLTNKR